MIITPPSITVTLVLAHKHAVPFTRPLFIVAVSPPAPPACLLVLHSSLADVSAQHPVFLLSYGVGCANTSCLFHGLALFLLLWENGSLHPYITPAKNWGLSAVPSKSGVSTAPASGLRLLMLMTKVQGIAPWCVTL